MASDERRNKVLSLSRGQRALSTLIIAVGVGFEFSWTWGLIWFGAIHWVGALIVDNKEEQ